VYQVVNAQFKCDDSTDTTKVPQKPPAGAAEGKEKWGQTHTHGERRSASLKWGSGGAEAEPPAGVQGAEPPVGSGGKAPLQPPTRFLCLKQ